jgi:glutamate dehydrogenase
VRPANVVAWEGDDPYLVVAADKGTATFSDIANGVSQSYGFWLDDAFASGGSNGYDHKKVGITARGGWMTVRRHMKELGIDPARQVFTAVGVGDTAGAAAAPLPRHCSMSVGRAAAALVRFSASASARPMNAW